MYTISLGTLCVFTASFFGSLTSTAFGQVLYEEFKLIPSDGTPESEYGKSVDQYNGFIAIGAWQPAFGTENTGVAYIVDSTTGVQVRKLTANDGQQGDLFGNSIAFDNGIVLVGSIGNDERGDGSGAAYLFNATTGVQYKKLVAPDTAAGDRFGQSVALCDNLAVVSAHWNDDMGNQSGSAYVFDALSGSYLFKLLPDDGDDLDWFGESVAIGDGVIAVAARNDDDFGERSGAVYLFEASTGNQFAKLTPDELEEDDQFGWDIAIDDGILAVSAYHDDDQGVQSGAVYLYDIHDGELIRKITEDSGLSLIFGRQVSIHNGVLAASALYHPANGFSRGSVYLFDIATGNLIAQLLQSDAGEGDGLGISLSIQSSTVVSGAPIYWDPLSPGSAYVFNVNTNACDADFNGDGKVDFFDLSAFLDVYSDGCP